MTHRAAILIGLSTLFFCEVRAQQKVQIPHNHTDIKTIGRIARTDSLLELYWSGTQIKANFTGTSIAALLKDEKGTNYYNIVVDGKLLHVLKVDSVKARYVLASGLKNQAHKLEIFRRTEWDRGITYFYGLEIDKDARLLPKDPDSKLKIEYFGNSITAGYAIDDSTGKDRPEGAFTNHYQSYAALTARHFEADHHCTCKSGIGIMLSWFPLTMPQLYDRLNPNDSSSKWNFTEFKPDIVVVNLLQNDSWLVTKREYPTFKATFGNTPPTEDYIIKAYSSFIKSIRQKYPQAHIVCMLGNMDITRPGSPWPEYVTKAVKSMADPRVHTLFVPFKGTYIHPLRKDNEAMAQQLIAYINKEILKK